VPEALDDSRRIASQIYLALAEQRYGDAAELAEAQWPTLISNQLPVLRAVADQLTDDELAKRPAWERIRRYLNYVMVDPAIRPIGFVEPFTSAQPLSFSDHLISLTMRAISERTRGHMAAAVATSREALKRLHEAPESELALIQHRLPDAFLQWGLSFEFAALEEDALRLLGRAYENAIAYGNTRVACDAAGSLAWQHAMAGRGQTADEWIARAAAIADANRTSSSWRRTDILATAMRLADELRPADALEQLAARPEGLNEHRLSAAGLSAIFRLGAGLASATLVLSELRRAATSNGPLLAEPGENTLVMSYAEALVQLRDGRPDRSIEILDELSAQSPAFFVIGLRATAYLAVGNRDAAERDAELTLARYSRWPRQVMPALVVLATLALESGDEAGAARRFTDACELALETGLLASLLLIPHADFTRLLELVGDRVTDPRITQLARRPLVFAPARRAAVNLSPRELEVLRELAQGGTVAEVAKRLHLSLNTVKVHNQSIYRKLGAENRADAVRHALERGII
jgi:DNA-binding CsgD family transcriptional regulator